MKAYVDRKKDVIKLYFRYDKEVIEALKSTDSVISPYKRDVRTYWTVAPTIESLDFLISYGAEFPNAGDKDYVFDVLLTKIEHEEVLKEVRVLLSDSLYADPIPRLRDMCKVQVKDYQWVPLQYALACDSANFLIADAMGGGKSLESTLITLHKKFEKHPVLIVGPKNVVANWQDELEKLFGIKSVILTETLEKLIPGIRYYICSYDQLKKQTVEGKRTITVTRTIKKKKVKVKEKERIASPLFRKNWFIIADESAAIKKRTTMRYKILKQFCKHAAQKVFLTGTPCDKPEELWTTLSLIDSHFMSWTAFTKKFCGMEWGKYGMVTTGATNQEAFHKLLVERFLIHRTKDQMLPFLPKKTRQTFNISKVTLPKSKSAIQMFTDNAKWKSQDPDFIEWLEQAMDIGDKVLTFGHHSHLLDLAEAICIERGWKYIRIDGSTPSECTAPVRCEKAGSCSCKTRQHLVRKFQSDPEIKIAILSLTAAGMGLNLTAASNSIFMEFYWSPGVMDQASDRTHRPGQENPVLLLYPLCTTFEHYIANLIFAKMVNIKRIIGGGISDDVADDSILKQIALDYDMPIK